MVTIGLACVIVVFARSWSLKMIKYPDSVQYVSPTCIEEFKFYFIEMFTTMSPVTDQGIT
jgi:hypothetical protein